MYSETCLNRSCSKAETLLRRKDAFDLVSFLFAFFARISKAKKRTLLQTDNIFSPPIKKHPTLQGHKNFRNFREAELNWTFLSIFSKRNIFLHFKTTFFLLISICSFEGVQPFSLELAIFYSKLLSATNQQLFLRH